MQVLNWVSEFIDLIISCVPKFVRIRATHRGVKWPRCKKPVALSPGIHWYWPIITECDLLVVARQTNQLPPQSLTLADDSNVSVSGVTVFSIDDPVAAIGEKNWDTDTTVDDLSRAAITEIVSECDSDQMRNLSDVNRRITELCRELLRPYGVNVEACKLLEYCESTTYRILGDQPPVVPVSTSED